MKKIDWKFIFQGFWFFVVLVIAILVGVFTHNGKTEEPTGIASEVIFFVIGVWVGGFISQFKHKEYEK